MKSLRSLVAGLALAGVGLIGASLPASAGDDDKHWGGLYIGASAGWMGADIDTFWPNRDPQTLIGNFNHDDSYGVFGGHVGFQHQFNHLVIGIEGFWGGLAQTHGWDVGNPNTGCPNTAFTCQARLDGLLTTIGGRIGWAVNDHWLIYATGGFATMGIETRSFNNATLAIFDTGRARSNGWYAGGGVEYALTKSWIIGLEYQHIELDDQLHVSVRPTANPDPVNDRFVDASADIVRARISYKLFRPQAEHESLK